MSQYLSDYVEQWGLAEPKPKGTHSKKPKHTASGRRAPAPPSHDIRKLMDPAFEDAPKPAEPPAKAMLDGQVEKQRACPEDSAHPTECFAANSGKLFWKCLTCKQSSGPFAGYPKLIGADGEEPRSRKRVAPVSETDPAPPSAVTSGVLEFSLESLARDIAALKKGQADGYADVIKRLTALEVIFSRQCEATNALVNTLNKQ
jgi:hypothetical protein